MVTDTNPEEGAVGTDPVHKGIDQVTLSQFPHAIAESALSRKEDQVERFHLLRPRHQVRCRSEGLEGLHEAANVTATVVDDADGGIDSQWSRN